MEFNIELNTGLYIKLNSKAKEILKDITKLEEGVSDLARYLYGIYKLESL